MADHLRDRCVERLEMDWPGDVYTWDLREQEATDIEGRYLPRAIYPHPITVIELALDLHVPTILTAAFYDLARHAPSRIAAGIPTTRPRSGSISSKKTADESCTHRLPIDILCRVFRGRERAQQYLAKFILQQVQHRKPSPECSFKHDKIPSRACQESFYYINLQMLRGVGGVDVGRDADPLYSLVQAMQFLSRPEISLCTSCKQEFGDACANARHELWTMLPEWFEIKGLAV